MHKEEDLIDKYGRETGFSVPENYFDTLETTIMDKLPPYQDIQRTVEMTKWQRVKPYVYLAAMFLGIWLMMNVFHRVSGGGSLSLENPPAAIASAMALESDEYIPYISVENDYMLEREVTESYDNFNELESDFGYEFKPEFATLDVPVSPREKSVINI